MITYIIIFVTAIVSIACFSNRTMAGTLALVPFRIVHDRQWYRVLTHGFVHGDYTHLIVNMLVLWSFGTYTEQIFAAFNQAGRMGNPDVCYLFLYIGGLIVASIHDIIKNRDNPYYVSIGASGAVAAVIFSSIFFNPWGKIYFFAVIPIPGILFGIFYLWYEQYMSKRGQGKINHNAHFYGAIYGFLFPILLNPSFINDFVRNIWQNPFD